MFSHCCYVLNIFVLMATFSRKWTGDGHFWEGGGSSLVLMLKWRRKIYRVTHTRLTALCPGLPGWAGTRKVIPIWILLKQETVSGSEIRWAICKSAPCSRQITTPARHRSVFLQAECPSCRPPNSVKALDTFIGDLWEVMNLENKVFFYLYTSLACF